MNNDENGIGLPPPTQAAPPMPECKPARREVPQFMQHTLDRVNEKERKNLETRVMWAACLTLERLGYTWEGGAEWKPPLGKTPNFDLLDAARAEIEQLRQQMARQEVRMDASPGFMEQSLARVSAAAGQHPLPADAPLETSEDEARPYVPTMAYLQKAYEATAGVRAALDKLGEAVGEGQIVDADYFAGDEEAISKALVELHDITRALTGYELGLPLFLPNEHEKLSAVLRKMLADQRAALAQAEPADPIPYQIEVKLSTSEAIKAVEDAIAAAGIPWSAAARDVLAERRRQQEVEGWTPEHDDELASGEISALAAEALRKAMLHPDWRPKSFDRREELKKAGALILAEIERLDRAAGKGGAA